MPKEQQPLNHFYQLSRINLSKILNAWYFDSVFFPFDLNLRVCLFYRPKLSLQQAAPKSSLGELLYKLLCFPHKLMV